MEAWKLGKYLFNILLCFPAITMTYTDHNEIDELDDLPSVEKEHFVPVISFNISCSSACLFWLDDEIVLFASLFPNLSLNEPDVNDERFKC